MAGPSAPQEPGSPGAGADDALDARLDRIGEALDRRKTEAAEAARRRSGPSSAGAMALGMRAMSELVAAVMVGAGMGWGLDRLVGSEPWGLIAGLALGGAAGFWGVYRLAARSGGGSSAQDGGPQG